MKEELLAEMDKLGSAFLEGEKLLRTENESLRSRVELLEANRERPRARGNDSAEAYKAFPTQNGTVYELPSTTKMADAIPQEKQPEISLERWLAATVAGEKCQDADALAFVREEKQLLTTTSGINVPVEYISDWIDLLRSAMVLNSAGMTTVTMEGKTQQSSAVTADPSAGWHSEAGSISVANPTFAARTLSAQTLVTRCSASVEVAQDSPDFGRQLAAVMTRAMAAELDRVGLVGSGTPPEPQGILGTSDIGQVAAVGVPTNFDELLTGVQTLLAANVSLEDAANVAIMAPEIWATYARLKTGISSDQSPLPRPAALETMRFLITSNIAQASPENSTVFLGDFRDLTLGIRREASIEILKVDSYVDNLVLEFIGYLRADYLVSRPASFVTLEGVASA